MLIMVCLTPAVMIGFGRRFVRRPPGEINGGYGYRTAMSMKNADTWAFAHRTCGRLWLRWGIAVLPVSVIPMLPVAGGGADTAGVVGGAVAAGQVILLPGTARYTEAARRKTFDSGGRRK